MKFKFEYLVPNETAGSVIEMYENSGYTIEFNNPTNGEERQFSERCSIALSILNRDGTFIGYLDIPVEWLKLKVQPNKWHDKSEFDGNPDNHIVAVFSNKDGSICLFGMMYRIIELPCDCEKFMYIPRS